jgi:hypothetical protein
MMRRRHARILIAVLAVSILASLAAAVERVVIADFAEGVDARGIPKGWQLKEKSGKADFSLIPEGSGSALALRSAGTSFSFQKEVSVDVKRYPLLTWTWMVAKLPKGGDFRKSRTDDQAAQLFVAFTRSRTIVYLWDTSAPQGLMADAPSPPFVSIKAVVVRSGPADTGKWITETRNVSEDFRKLFGEEPPPVSGMRIQINSQHTETSAESFFRDVMFTTQ